MTLQVGIALASHFNFGPIGQQRVEEIINTQPSGVALVQEKLWIGFKPESLMYTMASTAGSLKLAALCACLVDLHSVSATATILTDLLSYLGCPKRYRPTRTQLSGLASTCTGVMVKASFGELVGDLLGDLLWEVSEDDVCDDLMDKDTSHIPRALESLFQVSKGKVSNISMLGGCAATFVAALAHWLLELKVQVVSTRGELVFRSCPDSGVYCYLDTLQTLGGQAETACLVHVIHDNIDYEGRQYDSVVDLQGKRQFDYGGLQVKRRLSSLRYPQR